MSLFHEISQLDNFNYSFKLGVTRSDKFRHNAMLSRIKSHHISTTAVNPRSRIPLVVTLNMEYGAIIKHSHEFAVETKVNNLMSEYVCIH